MSFTVGIYWLSCLFCGWLILSLENYYGLQGMQHQYAQIATEIHASEVMLYNACRLKEAGLPFVKEASMVKLYSSQVAERTASKTIEWLGGIGFTKDLLAEKMYRDCKVSMEKFRWY